MAAYRYGAGDPHHRCAGIAGYIAGGTLGAFIGGLRLAFFPKAGRDGREVWLRYGRWLVAGLTFQLAADIIETSITSDWEAIGRLAAIAVIRTFLNFFLERDLAEAGKRRQAKEIQHDYQI